MRKHKRPVRHIRHVRTRKGRKAVVVNPNIVIHHKKGKKVICKGDKNYNGLIGSIETAFKYAGDSVGAIPEAIHIVGKETGQGLRQIKHGHIGKGVKDFGEGGVGAVKAIGKGGFTIVRGGIATVKELPKKPYI